MTRKLYFMKFIDPLIIIDVFIYILWNLKSKLLIYLNIILVIEKKETEYYCKFYYIQMQQSFPPHIPKENMNFKPDIRWQSDLWAEFTTAEEKIWQ